MNVHSPPATWVGARVSIHGPLNMPHPEIIGFNAPPGHETSVAVRAMRIHRLDAPFKTNCISTFPPVYLPFTSPYVEYSVQECTLACRRYHIQIRCACLEDWDIRLRMDTPSPSHVWCTVKASAEPYSVLTFGRDFKFQFLFHDKVSFSSMSGLITEI
jgi:hypothetical protein